MRYIYRFLTAAFLITVATASGASAQTKLVDTFKDWATYSHDGKPAKICFAMTKPTESLPKTLKRKEVFLYVSAWPKDGVKTEVSVKMGYPIKKDSVATIKIGTRSFRLLTDADKAFVDDPTAELKLIEAMKRGARLVVEAQTADGKPTKDTYSLRGITNAVKSLAKICS